MTNFFLGHADSDSIRCVCGSLASAEEEHYQRQRQCDSHVWVRRFILYRAAPQSGKLKLQVTRFIMLRTGTSFCVLILLMTATLSEKLQADRFKQWFFEQNKICYVITDGPNPPDFLLD